MMGFALLKLPHLLHKMGFVDSPTQTTVNGFVVVLSNVFQCKCYFSGKRAVAKASKELVYCSVT